ncbi:MAG: hypothetical protein H0Z19_07500 [Archaeoglobus sp.]|uniref:hypothetical protein n=1 Tax=Archaeoglobus sp. TaxID=1872626 RepID=UPI001DE15B73|nr:hypothetical protein [Archaeoglobus sp.]MBO8180309.1 hypothetical protein [Archaeoglobus sp.]
MKDRNPFPFEIELDENAKNLKVPEKIKVYSYELYQKPDEVFGIAKSFGVPADKLFTIKLRTPTSITMTS